MPATLPTPRRSSWYQSIYAWWIAPLLIVAVVISVSIARERTASRLLQSRLAEQRAAIERVPANSDGTWLKIFELASDPRIESLSSDLAYQSKANVYQNGRTVRVVKVAQWQSAPEFLRAFLADHQFLYELIKKACRDQIPIPRTACTDNTNYASNVYPHAKEVAKLLALEVDYALHIAKPDKQRAMEALDTMDAFRKILDIPTGPWAKLYCASEYLQAVRASLEGQDLWTTEDLERLRIGAQYHVRVSQPWDIDFIAKFSHLNTTFDADFDALTWSPDTLPSVQLCWHQFLEEAIRETDANPDLLEAKISACMDRMRRNCPEAESSQSYRNIATSLTGLAQRVADLETERRLIVTAIAIHMYRHRTGSWPKNLLELQSSHLPREDLQIVSGSLFGYCINSDEDSVGLWSLRRPLYESTAQTKNTNNTAFSEQEWRWNEHVWQFDRSLKGHSIRMLADASIQSSQAPSPQ